MPKAISWNREQKYSKAAPDDGADDENQQTVGVAQLIQAEGQHDAAEAVHRAEGTVNQALPAFEIPVLDVAPHHLHPKADHTADDEDPDQLVKV